MTADARLVALLEQLPAAALLPAGWVREQLAGATLQTCAIETGAPPPADLTVKQLGVAFGKSASTARLWCEQGKVPGAWKLSGREWRIPLASVDLFRQAQGATPPLPATGSLADWRKTRKAG